ncbi:hypothetical protein ACJZ2D_012910 [Fusarium nematophilum]
MDPFNSLPPEIRTKIHLFLCCKRQGLQLCRASPAMHQQYLASRRYIPRKLLARQITGDLLQDAMAIVLFPAFDDSVYRVMELRAEQQLPDPFEQRDYATIAKLEQLHDRMMIYVEDYIAKATASYPRERTSASRTCRQEEAAPAGLPEVRAAVQEGEPRIEWGEGETGNPHAATRAFVVSAVQRPGASRREIETIFCVQEYLESLYGAMFAQCGDAWLPLDPSTTSEQSRTSSGLLYSDTLILSADAYARDLGLSVVRGLTKRLAQFGFDLATSVIRIATAGPDGHLRLRRWFRDLTSEYGQHLLESAPGVNLMFPVGSPRGRPDRGPPSMYQRLDPTLEEFMSCPMKALRQRAWVFLDDARLYPGGKDDDADRLDSRLEPGAQCAVPRFFDVAQADQLIPFWRWDPHPGVRPSRPPFSESASREASDPPHQTLRTGPGPTAQSSSSHQPTSSLPNIPLSSVYSLDSDDGTFTYL